MPMTPGSSDKVKQANFHEFRHGETFKKTAAKFGKDKALKQMQAVVLSQADKSQPPPAPQSGLSTKLGRPAPPNMPPKKMPMDKGIAQFHARK